MNTSKKIWTIAALSGAMCVMLGAFGAHGLKAKLLPEQLQTFETGVRYQFYHTFALIACGCLRDQMTDSKWISAAAYCFVIGILFFSGSLYLLSNREWLGISSWQWLGPVTPLGGLLFITGWILLAVAVQKKTYEAL